MKFKSTIRMQAVLVGLGAALFFANAACAQQDVDPTTFETNPAAMQVARIADRAVFHSRRCVRRTIEAPTPAAMDTESVAVQEAGAKKWSPVDTLTLMATILVAGFRRRARNRRSTASAQLANSRVTAPSRPRPRQWLALEPNTR